MKRIISLGLVLLILLFSLVTAGAENQEITILFTHDLHSHLLPSPDEDGGEFGGYARLATVIKEQKELYPDALLVDGGDFSMGSLFQTAYPTSAIELRMMGAMGYDATTFGNHEYDYLRSGLASMLNAAKNSKDPLPFIVESNYLPKKTDKKVNSAFENYGVKDYVIIERNGVCFVVFGLFGIDADECAPNSKMIMKDMVTTAKKVINTATKECKDKYNTEPVVICLSHSGTEDGEGEDYTLAEKVPEIDVIVSGHTHTTLDKPIVVNDTYIVSAGEYGKNLGVVKLKNDKGYTLSSYELIPVDENVDEDKEIAKKVKDFKKNVEKDYLSKYGVSFDEILTENKYKFDSVDEVYATQHESTLGNVFSDAYKWAVEKETGESVDVALTAAGVIRETLPQGKVTVSDVFNAASLGVGTEGELVAVYISGRDLKNALEVDASVQPLMDSAQLFFSGVEYSFNTNRMIFNKVDYCALRRDDGAEVSEVIEDDKLYKIVTGMYCGQMLGAVEDTSMGLLSITPKDKDGNPIAVKDLKNYVVKDKNGNPIKEWYAIASYLKNMGGKMSAKYSEPDGRKVVYSSLNPIDLLKNPNKFTIIICFVVLIVIAVIVLLVCRRIKRKNLSKIFKGDYLKSERKILIAFLLNLFFSAVEFIGGLLTGSVAIISDAIHDFGDSISIALSFILEKISKKAPNEKYTYGYIRYSVLGGVITTVILLVSSVLVIYNATLRLINPTPVKYDGMIILAIIGTVVNFAAAYFTHEGDSINQKSVNLHMLEDVLGWICVLIGAVIIKYTGAYFIDPILSIAVAVFILINAVKNLSSVTDIFLEKTPKGIDLFEIKEHLKQIEGVEDIHHLHIWTIDGFNNYATLHIVTDSDTHIIKEMVKDELYHHNIRHATVETESTSEHCTDIACTPEFDTNKGHGHQEHHHHHHHH